MKIIEKTTKTVVEVVAITCDRCQKRYDDGLERQEFLCWSDTAGYGNVVFGDMNHVAIDLCQYCVKEVLGKWVRVTDPDAEEPGYPKTISSFEWKED